MNVSEAVGGRTVFGQLTVARATQRGFVTAYGCDDGIYRKLLARGRPVLDDHDRTTEVYGVLQLIR